MTMTKKMRKLAIILAIVTIFTVFASAASVIMSAGQISTAFFSQTVKSGGVTVNQTAATWLGDDYTVIWHMYSVAGNDYSFKQITGADTKTVYPKSANYGTAHKLQFENSAPNKITCNYTYTIN